jgi:hypothetical protein
VAQGSPGRLHGNSGSYGSLEVIDGVDRGFSHGFAGSRVKNGSAGLAVRRFNSGKQGVVGFQLNAPLVGKGGLRLSVDGYLSAEIQRGHR